MWEKHGTEEAAEIVRNGMRVSGAANVPKHDSGECELQGEEAKSMWEQIQKCLRRGVLEECEESELTAMSPLFLQEKSGGRGYRMLCNLEGPNSFAQGKSFRMESTHHAMRMMKKGVFMFCVDIADAFFTIRLHVEDRAVWGTSYTTSTGKRKFYKFLTGVQGGTDTPHCFDVSGASFMATASKAGVEATRHCDDCLGFGGMEETVAEREAERFLTLMDEFGWKPNVVKSYPHVRVSQEVKHLGFILNSKNMTVSVSRDRRMRMVGRATDMLSKSQWSCRQVQQVCGAIVSMLPVVQGKAIRRTRKLNGFLSKHMGSVPGKGLDKLHEASEGGKQELQYWIKMLARDPKRKLNRRVHTIRILASDASATGWGGLCTDSEGDVTAACGILNTDERLTSSTMREGTGLIATLKANKNRLQRAHAHFFTDNAALPAIIARGSKVQCLQTLSEEVEELCESWDCTLAVHWWSRQINVEMSYLGFLTSGMWRTTLWGRSGTKKFVGGEEFLLRWMLSLTRRTAKRSATVP